MKLPPVVLIRWRDSGSDDSWETKSSFASFSPPECWAVGFLISRNKERVIIVQAVGDDDDASFGALTIPRGCVISIETIRG